MAKPDYPTLDAGLEGGDEIVNEIVGILENPLPIKSYANVAALQAVAASSYAECLAIMSIRPGLMLARMAPGLTLLFPGLSDPKNFSRLR